jgi:ADP-ribose pyrophosphatase YjhB (NUDIX family)
MSESARAIIIENDQMLLMHRSKEGSQYFTLVGGGRSDDESIEDCLKRQVLDETGLVVTSFNQVFYEPHHLPINSQYVYICKVALHGDLQLQEFSEEMKLNNNPYKDNKHTPLWVPLNSFSSLPFRTPQLHTVIAKAIKKGFPRTVQHLS